MAFNLRNEHDLYEILGDISLMQSRLAMVEGNGLREIPWEQIRFDGWPRLDITLRGERFGGGPSSTLHARALQVSVDDRSRTCPQSPHKRTRANYE